MTNKVILLGTISFFVFLVFGCLFPNTLYLLVDLLVVLPARLLDLVIYWNLGLTDIILLVYVPIVAVMVIMPSARQHSKVIGSVSFVVMSFLWFGSMSSGGVVVLGLMVVMAVVMAVVMPDRWFEASDDESDESDESGGDGGGGD